MIALPPFEGTVHETSADALAAAAVAPLGAPGTVGGATAPGSAQSKRLGDNAPAEVITPWVAEI